jgi:hypothetical protein
MKTLEQVPIMRKNRSARREDCSQDGEGEQLVRANEKPEAAQDGPPLRHGGDEKPGCAKRLNLHATGLSQLPRSVIPGFLVIAQSPKNHSLRLASKSRISMRSFSCALGTGGSTGFSASLRFSELMALMIIKMTNATMRKLRHICKKLP